MNQATTTLTRAEPDREMAIKHSNQIAVINLLPAVRSA
jgi:hypothetical protein